MRISDREKTLLIILSCLIILFAYHEYVYNYQKSIINDKTKEKAELKEKYMKSEGIVESIESKKQNLKILKAKVEEQSSIFYPILSDEYITVELDKILNESGLSAGITFDKRGCSPVEEEKNEDEKENKSTLDNIVDDYKNLKNENGIKNEEKKSQKNDETSVDFIKCTLNFNGTYENLNKFLASINSNKKKIIVHSLSLDKTGLSSVSGSMNIEIYSVPKINNELEEYIEWPFNNTYGKADPFNKESVVGDVKKYDKVNFLVSVKSIKSDLPTVIIGKKDDIEKESYIYSDGNENQDVEMIFKKENNKYYYKYKTSQGSYPKDFNEIGEEFILVSESINIEVISEKRLDNDDKSGINLKIINETDKLIKINIENDDKDVPRVSVDADTDKTVITNK